MRRQRRDPAIRRLGKIPLFSQCTKAELALVARSVTDHRAQPGDVLVEQGRMGREVLVIIEGTAVVRLGDTTVARLGPGDLAGEVALLDHGPRTASVVAETPIVALVCSRHDFTLLLEHIPRLAHPLLSGLARRLRSADSHITLADSPGLLPLPPTTALAGEATPTSASA